MDAEAAGATTIAVVVPTTPLGDAEAADAKMIAIVAARRDDAAGRHRRCIILGRDDAPSHRTKCFL